MNCVRSLALLGLMLFAMTIAVRVSVGPSIKPALDRSTASGCGRWAALQIQGM